MMKRMLKNLLASLLVVVVMTTTHSTALAHDDDDDNGSHLRKLFDDFASDHNKTFTDEVERESRFQQFVQTEAYLQDFNKESGRSFQIKHSLFSDLYVEEVAERMKAMWANPMGERLTVEEEQAYFNLGATSDSLPKHVDWSTTINPLGKPITTPPANQGHCGACWALVAASVVESAVAITHGLLTPLSAQQLLDCDDAWNAGCLGGNPIQAFDYIRDRGLTSAQAYPYEGAELLCRKDAIPVSSIQSYRVLRAYDESILMAAVAHQPVAVGIAGQHSSFLFYGGGIYDDPDCGTELNHALVLVGYGTEAGTDYWIAKNSWGTGWGEDGYVRIARKTSRTIGGGTGPGICGLATAPSIPLGAYGGSVAALAAAKEAQQQTTSSMDSTLDPNGNNRIDDDGPSSASSSPSSSSRRRKKGVFSFLNNKDMSSLPIMMIGIITVIYLITHLYHAKKRRGRGEGRAEEASIMTTDTGGMDVYIEPSSSPSSSKTVIKASPLYYQYQTEDRIIEDREEGINHRLYQPIATRPPAVLDASGFPIATYADNGNHQSSCGQSHQQQQQQHEIRKAQVDEAGNGGRYGAIQ